MSISDSALSERVERVKRALEDNCSTGEENGDYAGVSRPEFEENSMSYADTLNMG